MTMRISEQSRVTRHIGYVQGAEGRLDRIQEQLSTGKQVRVASDDPEGASISMGHRRELAFETQMRRNLESGIAFMNATEAALSSAGEAIHRARELAVQGANGTNSQQGREAMAIEVDQLLKQMMQIGNTTFGEAYIFAGTETNQPAFSANAGPVITAVTYDGNTGLRERRVSKQDTAAVNVTGNVAFPAIFQDLIALRDALNANDPNINQHIANMDSALDTVLSARADIGARINRFEDARLRSGQKDIDLQELRAEIEDVDLAEAIVKLTAEQNQLEAALGAIGRTSGMTLMDFLR
jgi:flagellar hook-associated protein 3 FlgL